MDADKYGFRIVKEVKFYVPTIKFYDMDFDIRNNMMW